MRNVENACRPVLNSSFLSSRLSIGRSELMVLPIFLSFEPFSSSDLEKLLEFLLISSSRFERV